MYKVDLKPHNEQTMEKIIEFFKTSNKCCAIQATGTGKTFLILRLLEMFQNKDKNAVIFAPNREIIKQTKNKMKKYGINNAVFYTYQKLSRMSDNEIVNVNADLIVCDELHRTGAKTWGIKFESLVDSHPNAKVFGVTATPLRCADGRDMAEEYFDNNKACDISLAEALVRKIIPVMPVYVSALYTFEEEYDNMVGKIKKGRNSDEEKSELTKELKAAKQQLEKSNGIPEIIKKYITNYNGKYIVFCKDKNHLYDMKDVVIQWFRDAGYNGKIFEYPYYSCSSEVKKNLINFENNEEEGLKLLFVIDKLNEGLHLDVIHGCILLRTTTSNIIYYQQIGRAIDAGCNQKRVILDLVSNFNSLKSFNLKKELNEKIIERQNGKFSECSKEFDVEEFYINDCVQKCIDVFNKIDSYILNKGWSKEEDNILIKNYPTICMGVIDMLDGRTEESIKGRVRQLGIKYRNIDYWITEEDDILKQYYPTEGRNVYKRFKNRTMQQCQTRAQILGLKSNNNNAFTEEEITILEKYYPMEGRNVYKRLNGRTASACAGYCKTHGIRKSSYNDWTEDEDDFLIKNYPMEGKKCFTNLKRHTEYQCINRVKKLNIQYIADKWTKEEEQILIKFFPLEGKECFSRIIGRTKSSCEHKISRLGLTYSNTIKI
nr:MAG TPA: Chromatin remodeling complex ATPase [Caudoviricetes sp.]